MSPGPGKTQEKQTHCAAPIAGKSVPFSYRSETNFLSFRQWFRELTTPDAER